MLGSARAQRRLILTVLVSFAALALLLAAVGIYGVISYSVRQRTHELGIRMALGATAGDVLKLILTQGLKLTVLGVVLGLGAAVLLTLWMETLLFNVRPTDPLTFTLIALVLLLVTLLACWIPAGLPPIITTTSDLLSGPCMACRQISGGISSSVGQCLSSEREI